MQAGNRKPPDQPQCDPHPSVENVEARFFPQTRAETPRDPARNCPGGELRIRPDITLRELAFAFLAATLAIALTRYPVARHRPMEFDEFGMLWTMDLYRMPMHHTLYLALGRVIGDLLHDRYAGLVVPGAILSVPAVVSTWWFLRGLATPAQAVAGAVVIAACPIFWAYGAMAGNYAAIVLVGTFLLGIAVRSTENPRAWHPYAAALVLAAGAGYRQDIGIFWLPVFAWILSRAGLLRAVQAGLCFVAFNLAWLVPMLADSGGYSFRERTLEFSRNAGLLNSYWTLGWIDATLRYALKEAVALVWCFGPGLVWAPSGLARLISQCGRRATAALLILSIVPALAFHLLIHFGVQGYALHLAPALIALIAIGAGAPCATALGSTQPETRPRRDLRGPTLLLGLASLLAAAFWFYPTNYDADGFWGDFNLAFARQTRAGLARPAPFRTPKAWRTLNSQVLPGGGGGRAPSRRETLSDLLR